MSYDSRNPNHSSEILTDQAATAVGNAPSSSHRLVNRNGRLYMKDSSGTELLVGTAAQTRKNYITNPSCLTDTTGWAASGSGVTIARTTTSAELPRVNLTGAGLKITPVSGTTDYARIRWTADAADYFRKLPLVFDMNPLSGYAAGDLKVDIYVTSDSSYATGLTRIALSTDSSAVTALPNATGTFQTSFDGQGATNIYYELRFTRVAGTTALVISDVLVGPGVVLQGAAIGPWVSYTPTFNAALGTCTNVAFRYRRNGENMDIEGNLTTGTPDNTTAVKFPLPSGFTGAVTVNQVLTGLIGTEYTGSTTGQYFPIMLSSDTSNIQIGNNLGRSSYTPVTSGGFIGSENVSVKATVRINEWIGSGAVNVSQNDIAYYSCVGTWGTTGAQTVISGPTGSLGGTTTPAGTVFNYTFTPSVAIPIGAIPVVQVSGDGTHWSAVPGTQTSVNVETLRNDGTNSIGIACSLKTNGDIRMDFGKYANGTSGAWTGTWYWRVAVGLPGQAVGFGAATATSAGLVSTTTQTFSGIKSNASMPAFRAKPGTSKVFRDTGGVVDLTGASNIWDATLTGAFNQGSGFVAGTGTNGGKFVVPTGGAGIYHFWASVGLTGTNVASGDLFRAYFRVNGATMHTWERKASASSDTLQITSSITLSLADGDTVNIAITTNHASTDLTTESDATANLCSWGGYKLF